MLFGRVTVETAEEQDHWKAAHSSSLQEASLFYELKETVEETGPGDFTLRNCSISPLYTFFGGHLIFPHNLLVPRMGIFWQLLLRLLDTTMFSAGFDSRHHCYHVIQIFC